MSLINLSVKHGRTLEEARTKLETTVQEVRTRFSSLVQRVEWAADHNRVKLFGPGYEVEMWVDAQDLHVVGDFPLLGGLLGNPLLSGLKGLIQHNFQKQLPGGKAS